MCILQQCNFGRNSAPKNTLFGTNISPKQALLKLIFLFPRWDMLVPRSLSRKPTPQGCCTYPWSLRPRHPTEKPSRGHYSFEVNMKSNTVHWYFSCSFWAIVFLYCFIFMRLPCMVNLQLNVKLKRSTKTTGDQKHGTPPIGTSSVLSCHPKAPAFSCAWLGSDPFTLLYHVVPDSELPCDYFKGGTVGLFYSTTWQNNASRNHYPWSFEVAAPKIWSPKNVETQGYILPTTLNRCISQLQTM